MSDPVVIAGIDIETTGLNQAEGHRIIEFAAVFYKLHDGVLTPTGKSFVTRVNPERPIDPGAQEVHGISFEELADCPKWEDAAPLIQRVLSSCRYLVAHNGGDFDLPFIWAELIRVGQSPPQVALIDTLYSRWATPDGALPSLKALCFACGIEYDQEQAHGALYDVQVMMQCLQKEFRHFQLPADYWEFTAPVPKKKRRSSK